MRTRRLGSSDLEVTVVGLGCNNFGGRIDEAAARAVIDAALDAGVTFFDTADVYGNRGGSEEIIGRALARPARPGRAGDEVRPRPRRRRDGARGTRPYIRKAVEARCGACRRTGSTSTSTTAPTASRRSRRRSRRCTSSSRRGRCARSAPRTSPPAMVEEAAAIAAERGLTPFVSEQSEYSWLARGAEEELLPACERLGDRLHPLLPARERAAHRQVREGRAGARGHPPGRARARRRGPRHRRAAAGVRASATALAARRRDRRARRVGRRRLGDRRRDEAGAGARERRGRRVGADRESSSPSFVRSSSRARRDRRRRRARLPRPRSRHGAGDRPATGADRPGLVAARRSRTRAAQPVRRRWRLRSHGGRGRSCSPAATGSR